MEGERFLEGMTSNMGNGGVPELKLQKKCNHQGRSGRAEGKQQEKAPNQQATVDLLASQLLGTMIATTKKGKANVLGHPDINNKEC